MASLPSGSTFFVATAFSPAIPFTAITNAAEAVVTSTAHGLLNNDIVEVTSAWGRLTRRAFRVKNVSANNYTLESANTTNTSIYPAGSGTGSVRKVNTFVQLTQTMNPQASGGEPKKVTYKYTEDDNEQTINDGFSATSRSIEIDADAIGTVGYTALRDLTEVQTNTILKTNLKSGSFTLLSCTIALNEEANMQEGQINRVKADFSGNSKSTRYTA